MILLLLLLILILLLLLLVLRIKEGKMYVSEMTFLRAIKRLRKWVNIKIRNIRENTDF